MLIGRKFTNTKSNIVYDIKEKIGAGSFGTAYGAADLSNRKLCAIKVTIIDTLRYLIGSIVLELNVQEQKYSVFSYTTTFTLYHYNCLIPLHFWLCTTTFLKKWIFMCNSSLFHYAAPFSFFILFYFTYMVYFILIHFNLIHFNLIFIIQLKYISFWSNFYHPIKLLIIVVEYVVH